MEQFAHEIRLEHEHRISIARERALRDEAYKVCRRFGIKREDLDRLTLNQVRIAKNNAIDALIERRAGKKAKR